MSALTVALMGAPHVEVEGSPLDVDTRKATALLAYLAITGESHRRDAIAGLLWPEHDQEGARGALRRTLSTLKKALGGKWLVADRVTVALSREGVSLDVGEFRSLVAEVEGHDHSSSIVCATCERNLRRAVRLYRGNFMAGFSLRDSVEFEDWQYYQSEELRRMAAGALERIVQLLVDGGRHHEAIDFARRWLALDPLHEPAHRRLMQLYSWSGERAAALKQYRECVALLDRELGVAPLEETVALYEAIGENAVPAPEIEETPAARAGGAPEYPLVGREPEWRALIEGYEAVRTDGSLVLVEGEAGIGKSRLVDEFATFLSRRSAPVAGARCHAEETSLAYGSITEVLRGLLVARPGRGWLEGVPPYWLSEAARLLPELQTLDLGLPPAPPLDGPGAQARFLEGLHQFLLAGCAHTPGGLLFVDDLHWADDASLDFLTYVCARLEGRPLCLLLAWRSEEVGAGHRIRQLVQAPGRHGSIFPIELKRLDRAAIERLAEEAGGDINSEVIDRLYRETEGLPFFVVEYLTALKERGDSTEQWTTPAGVRDLLKARLGRVTETGWQVLSASAVVGSSFDFDTVREASGRGEEETITALEELASAGLIKELAIGAASRTPTYDFSHERIRALVYEETSTARRRLLHRRVAEALTRVERRSGVQTSLIAHHYEEAGEQREAAEFYEQAGRRAASLYAHAEALTHYRAALALDHPSPWRLHEVIGDILTLVGEYSSALMSYETAAALGPPNRLAELEHRLGNVHDRRGDFEVAKSHYEAALAVLGDDDPERAARVHADASLNAHRRGAQDEARVLAEKALTLAEQAGEPWALAQAHNVAGVLAKAGDDMDRAVDEFATSARLAETLHDPSAHVAALNNLALAHGAAGDFDQAISYAEKALELCAAQHDRHREAAIHNNLADLLHAAGRTDESMSHLKEAVAIFAEVGSKEDQPQPEIWKLVEW